MGLDNYFARRAPVKDKVIAWPNASSITRGMLATDPGWLRGKVYDQFIEDVTGQSLYQETISEEQVALMAGKLTALIESLPLWGDEPDVQIAASALPWFLEHERDHNEQSSRAWFGDTCIQTLEDGITQEEVVDLTRLFRFAAREHMILEGRW